MVQRERSPEDLFTEQAATDCREQQQHECYADDVEEDALEHHERRQGLMAARQQCCDETSAVLPARMQPMLGRRHEQRLQRGQKDHAVGQRAHHQVRHEERRLPIERECGTGEEDGQHHHDHGQRRQQHRQAPHTHVAAFQPDEQQRDPDRGRQQIGKAEMKDLVDAPPG